MAVVQQKQKTLDVVQSTVDVLSRDVNKTCELQHYSSGVSNMAPMVEKVKERQVSLNGKGSRNHDHGDSLYYTKVVVAASIGVDKKVCSSLVDELDNEEFFDVVKATIVDA